MEYANKQTGQVVSSYEATVKLPSEIGDMHYDKSYMLANVDLVNDFGFCVVTQPDNPYSLDVSDILWNGEQAYREVVGEEPTDEEKLLAAKNIKIKEMLAYGSSEKVNVFTYGGKTSWLSRSDRLAIKGRLTDRTEGDNFVIVFNFDGIATRVNMPKTQANSMLLELDLYADKCFDKDGDNAIEIQKSSTISAVDSFDYKSSYPAIKTF